MRSTAPARPITSARLLLALALTLALAVTGVMPGTPAAEAQDGTPTFLVDPGDGTVTGGGWRTDTPITITIGDPADPDFTQTEEGNEWGSIWITVDHDIEVGDLVTVTDGETPKSHTVAFVTVDVDRDTHTAFGEAEPGTTVTAQLIQWAYGPEVLDEETVVADGDGTWSVDFAARGHEIEDHHSIWALVTDEDGDSTRALWAVRFPQFTVLPQTDRVIGHEFAPRAQIEIAIGTHTQTTQTDRAGFFTADLDVDVEAGQLVSVTDPTGTFEHRVLPVEITDIDTRDNVVHGLGEPNREVRVGIDGEPYVRAVDVAADGTWSVEFNTEQADNPFGQPVDLLAGMTFEARQFDDVRNDTAVFATADAPVGLFKLWYDAEGAPLGDGGPYDPGVEWTLTLTTPHESIALPAVGDDGAPRASVWTQEPLTATDTYTVTEPAIDGYEVVDCPEGVYTHGGASQDGVGTFTVGDGGRHFVCNQATTAAAGMERLAGAGRVETAAAVSAARFDPGVAVAFVATAGDYPDALAGGPAAATLGGPILLTAGSSLPEATRTELTRLQPGRIAVLGGASAVPDSVVAELDALTAGTVERYAGATRYETAAAISSRTYTPGAPVAFVATGLNFPDALTGGAAAAELGGPVLLTDPAALSTATRTELERLAPQRIIALGGRAAVSDGVLAELQAITTTRRLSGATRFDTAAAVATAVFTGQVDTVYVATGMNFPDALAGTPAAGLDDAPLLLVSDVGIPDPVRDALEILSPARIVILGGTAAVSTTIEQALAAHLRGGPPPPAPTQPAVHGTVSDESTGTPIAGADVYYGEEMTTTASDGTYAIYDLAAGEHSLSIQAEGYQGRLTEPFTYDGTTPIELDITLIPMTGPADVTGTVTDEGTGEPIEGAHVSLFWEDGGTRIPSVETDEAGAYALRGVDADRAFRLRAVGPWQLEDFPGWDAEEVYVSGIFTYDGTTAVVVDIALTPPADR
jgi:putative cell wall-binding protein